MNDEQKLLLDLLIRTDKFLKKRNINYYLDGGTAIGAIRHNGFLPWDDDADIYMTRDEYKKMISYSNEFSEINADLACFETYPDYSKTAARISDLNNTMIIKSDIFHGKANGQSIDVFILDPVPSDKIDEYSKNLCLYEEILTYNYVVNNRVYDYIDEYKEYLVKEKELGREATLKELKESIEKYSQEESDKFILRWGNIPMVYDKEVFGTPRYINFEGYMLPCPQKTEAFLRTQFGYDWYIIPKAEHQVNHDLYINNEISSNNYVNDFNEFVNEDEAEYNLKNRKIYWVENIGNKMIMDKVELLLQAKKLEMQFEMDKKESILTNLYKSKNYEEFINIMDPFIENIKTFIDCSYIPDIKLEIYLKEIYLLILSGRHYDAKKLYNLVKKDNNDNEQLNQLKDLITLIEKIDSYYQDKELIKVENEIKNLNETYNMIPNVINAKIEIELLKDSKSKNIDEIYSLCENYLQYFPNNYDVLKKKGDILYFIGDKEKAINLFKRVIKNSNNGLILLELKEKYDLN
ncbi:LicD family protein [Anaerofustis stercorihominis]|uniref:LicD/FKTN/FKRP nucleotidyltransferase domain-containing protein n=1 Tax=Anaerofustis stercorihominis TaxID=214853 RepID=A0A3E3DYH5_9FIRM|nr:LicD family protein [Anaerofustis stercorihominis]RGD74165.1 hypothetical protein DW687_05200 [Anaerofustis stercorihominis]